MIGRLPWSRSPSEPNTRTRRPGVMGRTASQRQHQRVRRVRVVDERRAGSRRRARSRAPCGPGSRARGRPPRSRRPGSTPAACASTIASAAFETLTRPGSGLAASCSRAVRAAERERRADAVEADVGAVTVQSASTPEPARRRDGLHRDLRLGDEPSPPLVVDDHDAPPRLPGREQAGLVPEVALHVAVEVEVVALQVGETDHVEHEPVDPAAGPARAS